MHRLAAVTIAALLCGCSHHFTRVDFKYTSDAYLRPADRFQQVNAPPATVGSLVQLFITQRGGRVVDAKAGVPFRFEPGPQAEPAFAAARALFEQEWDAYQQNDFSLYKALDRKDPLIDAPQVVQVPDPEARTSWVKARMAPRTGKAQRTLSIHVTVHWKVDEEIETALMVWWWPRPDGTTVVFARALPVLPKYGAEAGSGGWVQYSLWPATTGAADAQIVQDLFFFLTGGAAVPSAPAPATGP